MAVSDDSEAEDMAFLLQQMSDGDEFDRNSPSPSLSSTAPRDVDHVVASPSSASVDLTGSDANGPTIPPSTYSSTPSSPPQDENDTFLRTWTRMRRDLSIDSASYKSVSSVLRDGFYAKVDRMLLIVTSFEKSRSYCADAVLTDPTGSIDAFVHRDALEAYKKRIANGAGLLVEDVSVFTSRIGRHALVVTARNITRICWPTKFREKQDVVNDSKDDVVLFPSTSPSTSNVEDDSKDDATAATDILVSSSSPYASNAEDDLKDDATAATDILLPSSASSTLDMSGEQKECEEAPKNDKNGGDDSSDDEDDDIFLLGNSLSP